MPFPVMNNHLSHLQNVCDNATVALFVMDERQCCVYMNPAAEQLTGYRLHEVQGGPLHDFVHHTRPDGSHYRLEDCPIDRAAPENMQERGEEIFVHRDGSFYPVSFTASPIRQDGAIIGTVIEVVDARPRIQQERERDTLHAIGQLILQELDHEKIVRAVTDAATRLTGAHFGAFFYNLRDENGESYTLYTISGVPKEKFDQFPVPRATHLFGPTFRGEKAIRSGNIRVDPRYGKMGPHHGMPPGHLPVCSYLAVPVSLGNGEVIGGLFFGHPDADQFTESHERLVETLAAQAAIGLNKASLYQEALYARRRAEQDALEKQRLYEEAARANEAKDQFLATVSHELRTPLTSILGWSQMLASGKVNDAMRDQAIATIERNARMQAQIVEDLLDISRIVSGKLRLNTRLFLPQIPVEAAVEAVRPSALAKNIDMDFVFDPSVEMISGDPERLQQIVWNLLSNAIKFTPKNGRVVVLLSKVDSAIELVVSDNGIGVPPEYLPRIFDSFTQVDSTSTRKHGGLGLGLAIVKKLVELHGGRIEAASAGAGHGAEFRVSLPLRTAHEGVGSAQFEAGTASSATVPQHLDEYDLEGTTILLIEDDDDARDMLASVLRSTQARVETASNGVEGLSLFDRIQPDLVVSDIGMPGMDGFELITELRRRERSSGRPQVPAVALTAFARVQDRMRALASGFQMHVSKPVEPPELLAVLSSLRSWRRSH